MDLIIGLSPILLYIAVSILIGIVVWKLVKKSSNVALEKKIKELEEENKKLRKNNDA
jgi:hypothetical protein